VFSRPGREAKGADDVVSVFFRLLVEGELREKPERPVASTFAPPLREARRRAVRLRERLTGPSEPVTKAEAASGELKNIPFTTRPACLFDDGGCRSRQGVETVVFESPST